MRARIEYAAIVLCCVACWALAALFVWGYGGIYP